MTAINDIDLDKGTVNVAEYSKADAAISELRQQYADISAVDPDTDEGYTFLKAGIKEVAGYRTALEKKRKEIKDPFLKAGKIIDGEAKRITAALVELEDPMKAKKAIRDEREKREKEERIARLQKKVDNLKAFVDEARGKSSDLIANLIEELDAIDTEQDFYDLTTEACVAKRETLEKLNEIYTERLAFERAEQERAAAEAARRELEEKQARERRLNSITQVPMAVFGRSSAEILQRRQELIIERDQLADAIEIDEKLWSVYAQSIAMLATMAQQAAQLEAATPAEDPESKDEVNDLPSAPEAAEAEAEEPAPHFTMPIGRRPQQAPEETVTISRREYEGLLADQAKLEALEDAGVAHWSGYDKAMRALHNAA